MRDVLFYELKIPAVEKKKRGRGKPYITRNNVYFRGRKQYIWGKIYFGGSKQKGAGKAVTVESILSRALPLVGKIF